MEFGFDPPSIPTPERRMDICDVDLLLILRIHVRARFRLSFSVVRHTFHCLRYL